jgi:formamidopyrimidine-DNA glycosylase
VSPHDWFGNFTIIIRKQRSRRVPELPEVETVVRDLRPHLVGRRLARVHAGRRALRRKWSPAWARQITGRPVRDITRRGKWILLDLDGPWLLVHLGMTGQFKVVPVGSLKEDHTHLIFGLDDGVTELRFRDIRRFGSVSLFAGRDLLEQFFQKSGLGPEPWDLAPGYWRTCFAKTSRCLKAVLLDQRVVAGVGNIYADESLFEAKLNPSILGKDLPSPKAQSLRRAVVAVLERAINCHGSSIRNYVGGSGLEGEYQNEFRAYGRTGEPCPRCRTPIERVVLAGRATHFCPRCQRLD